MEDTIRSFILTALTRLEVAAVGGADILTLQLSALGLDSLDFMELLNDVEEKFDIRFEDDTVTARTTVAELIAQVEALVAGRNSK